MPSADSITILHLSDIQFGRHHRFQIGLGDDPDAGWDTLLARLKADLDKVCRDEEVEVDLVVVTGDLAEWAKKTEYEHVAAFLGELARHLALQPRHVLVVPGNHDISRPLCQAYFLECQHDDEDPTPPYWPKWKPWAAFFEGFYGQEYAFEPGTPWTLFELPELRVVVAGLNSTMAESHRDDDHHGKVGEDQARRVAAALEPYHDRGWLRIGLVHHNPFPVGPHDHEHLHDAAMVRSALKGSLNVLLHGHTHQADVEWWDQNLPVLSTGSAAVEQGARPTEVPNQYQILRVRRDGYERWGRAYLGDEDRWAPDPRIEDSGYERRTIEFEGVEGTFPAENDERDFERHTGDLDLDTAPDFAHWVAEACMQRHPGAGVTIHRGGHPIWLTVTRHERGRVERIPVGVFPEGLMPAELERFEASIVRAFRAADPHVVPLLVVGGDLPDPALVADARRRGLEITSFAAFQGLLDLRPYLDKQTKRLAADRLYPPSLYVDQRLLVGLGAEAPVAEVAFDQVEEWLHDDKTRFILLLGIFGTGKTFLMHELARRLGANWERSRLAPILIELGQLEKTHKVEELVASHLMKAGERSFDREAFVYMLERGRIAMLFDGLDELVLRVEGYDRAAAHLEMLRSAAREHSKVVVTCRTEHFLNDEQIQCCLGVGKGTPLYDQLRNQAGLVVARLRPFERPQIKAFLERRLGSPDDAAARLALIDEIPDLLGLSSNPRMLDYIARLPAERLEDARKRTGEVTPASLYEELVSWWLEGEVKRREPDPGAIPAMKAKALRHAVDRLAIRAWGRTDGSVRLDDMEDELRELANDISDTRIDLEAAVHQVGSGSLLVRDDQGRFRFVHQSVLEFLVACSVASRLLADEDPPALTTETCSPLMARFLLDLVGADVLSGWVQRVMADDRDDAPERRKQNALELLELSGVETRQPLVLAGQDLRGRRDLSCLDLRGADLREADLSGMDLCGLDLSNVDLRGANLRRSMLMGANLEEARLEGACLELAGLFGPDSPPLDKPRGYKSFGAAIRGPSRPQTTHRAPSTVVGELSWCGHSRNLIAVGTWGGHVVILDGPTGQPLRWWYTGSLVTSLAFSSSGEHLATGGSDGSVMLWDSQEGSLLIELEGHRGRVRSVCFSPEGTMLATSGDDCVVKHWDCQDGSKLLEREGRGGRVRAVRFSPNGATLATGHSDGHVRLWYEQENTPYLEFRAHRGRVMSIAFTPDGSCLASAGDDGFIRLWSVQHGTLIRKIEGHQGGSRSLTFSADGAKLASGGQDRFIRIWNARDGRLLNSVEGHRRRVSTLDFSPNGGSLASGSADGSVRLWNDGLDTGRTALKQNQHGVLSVAYSPNGTLIASGMEDGFIRLWGQEDSSLLFARKAHRSHVWSIEFSPDGSALATASIDGTVRLCNIEDGSPRFVADVQRSRVFSVGFSPDGKTLASGSDDGHVRLWNSNDGSPILDIDGHTGRVLSTCFTPDGSSVVSGGDDGEIKFWDSSSGSRKRTLRGHRGSVWCIRLSPNGHTLASGGSDSSVKLWDSQKGSLLVSMNGHRGRVWSVGFSLDGTTLASGGDEGSVRLWDQHEARQLQVLEGHQGRVSSVTFSPDGTTLASGGSEGSIKLWALPSGSLLVTLVPTPNGWAGILPDGRYLAMGDATKHIWHVAGLVRFEAGSLDRWLDTPLRLPPDTNLMRLARAQLE